MLNILEPLVAGLSSVVSGVGVIPVPAKPCTLIQCRSPSTLESTFSKKFEAHQFPRAMERVLSFSENVVSWTAFAGADKYLMTVAAIEALVASGCSAISVEKTKNGIRFLTSSVGLDVEDGAEEDIVFTCYGRGSEDAQRVSDILSSVAAASLAKDVGANFRSYSWSSGGSIDPRDFSGIDRLMDPRDPIGSLFGRFFDDSRSFGDNLVRPPQRDSLMMPPQREERSMRGHSTTSAIAELEAMGVQVVLPRDLSALESSSVSWSSLAGYESVKSQVEDTVILSLKHPSMFEKIIAKTRQLGSGTNRPKVVLFQGPPGTGKTSTCKIIAKETNVPMIHIPLESIVSKWFGESEKQVAKIYDLAKEVAKSQGSKRVLLFIDEIDSLVSSRDLGSPHEASKRILSVLLRQIDGFEVMTDGRGKDGDNNTSSAREESSISATLICATNRPQDLDSAFLSRVDASIEFPLPNEDSRKKIFKLYAKHLTEKQVDEVARASHGLSGRNIKDLCQAVERRWAADLIRGSSEKDLEKEEIQPPPGELYLEECGKKCKQQIGYRSV